MRRSIAILAIISAATIAAPAAAQLPAAATDKFLGTWQGTLGSPSAQLPLGLAIAREPGGQLRAALTSGNQPGLTIPATVSLHADTLIVDIDMIHGTYAAVTVGDSLRGFFTQGGKTLPFNMGHVGAVTTPHAQEPQPPFPYRTAEVSFQSKPGVQLAGTITLPAGAGPFPAVVLVPGSGPEDRDESYAGHKPFLVLADYLARNGIASLRYDDRGVGKSTGSYAGATTADLATDAEAALHFLESNAAVARGKVGIVGHSEGGMIGPMIAAHSADVAYLVLLAAPGLPGDSVAMLQKRMLFANNGLDPVEMGQAMRFTREVYQLAKSPEDSATATAKIRALTTQYIATLSPAEQANAAQDGLAESAGAVTGPWFRYVLRYDPRTALLSVHVPVLALAGARDELVPAHENLAGIDNALKAAGNKDYKVLAVPNVNHSLQTTVAGGPTDPGTIEETLSPAVLDLVTAWIKEHTGGR